MSHSASNPLKHSIRHLLRSPRAALAMLGLPGLALAGPGGEDVIRGAADITRPNANGTVVDQYTQRAVINWQTFNVDADEYVLFNQPSSSSVVLNRVIGGDASHVLGQMQANGQVFLLNAQGVFFGADATIDVQGFLGSTLDMDPDAFMAGNFALTRDADSPSSAFVVNDGRITAGPGGYVVLAGDYTENTGIVAANAGTVALVSGNALTLDIEGDGLVNFAINEATLADAAGVRNAGHLIADGGRVIMTAKVANDLVASAVNNEGVVRARSIEERNGEIYLMGHGGDVVNSGTLDADGENANGGGIALYSDRDVLLKNGGVQTAAGDAGHDGGVIRAIAEQHLDYQRDNLIRATGGINGGFVEVSGHGSLNLRGIPDIGAGGTFLIDPADLEIRSAAGQATGFSSSGGCVGSGSCNYVRVDYVETNLAAGVDVLLLASNSIVYNGAGDTLNASGGSGDLTLAIGTLSSAGGASDAGTIGNVYVGGAPTYTPGQGGVIDLTGLDIAISGDIKLHADNGTMTFDRLATSNGNIQILGAGSTGINGGAGGIVATIGNVDINAGSYGGLLLAGGVNAGGDINLAANQIQTRGLNGASVSIDGLGPHATITVDGAISADGFVYVGNAGSGSGQITLGDVQASAIDVFAYGSNDDIQTGSLTVTNNAGSAWINVSAGGGIAVNGDITASGYGESGKGFPLDAVSVDLLAANGDLRVQGGVNITGRAAAYAAPGSSGMQGHVRTRFDAGGDLVMGGAVNVTGVGVTEVSLSGTNVTTANINVLAEPENFSRTYGSAGATIVETAKVAGSAELYVNAFGGDINVGNLSVKGPNANVDIHGARITNTGAIKVSATGSELSFAASYGGATGTETMSGGFAGVFVTGASGQGTTAINIGGNIDVSARGFASAGLNADTVAARSISVAATQGVFVREGDYFQQNPSDGLDGPFGHVGFGGPRVDIGTITGGGAHLQIGGQPTLSLCDGLCPPPPPPLAHSVQINGSLAVSGPGEAILYVDGEDITVSGGISATATRAAVDGVYFDSGSTGGGTLTTIEGSVQSSIGIAQVELNGLRDTAHAVSVGGAVTVTGPRTRFNASGGNVTLQDLNVTANGFDLAVAEIEKDGNGLTVGEFSFQGSHMVTGVGVEAVGAAKVRDVSIAGPGAAGIIFEGATITTGNINVRATAGEFTATTPSFNGGQPTTQVTGAALVGFESPAAATVNGGVTVEGARTVHIGGRANISGDFTVKGGESVLAASVPAYVDFLDHLDDGDGGQEPLTLPAAQVRAANITATVTNGNLSLGNAQLVTNGAMTLNASGNVDLSGRTQTAGSFNVNAGRGVNISNAVLTAATVANITAGRALNAAGTRIEAQEIRLDAGTNLSVSNISLDGDAVALVAGSDISNSSPPGTITAGALAILAGGDVRLGNTRLVVGSGRIDSVAGDTRFLELLAMEGIAVPTGGPNLVVRGRSVELGGGSLAGDYVYLETDSLVVNGAFDASNSDLLLQVAPHALGTSFSLEQSTPGGGGAAYAYTGMLDRFGAATIALGTTQHTGAAGIGANSTTVNIGASNLFVLTKGEVRGLDRVLSTGVVKDLQLLLSGGFEIPQTDEIDVNNDLVQTLQNSYRVESSDSVEEEEEGDEEGEDTDSDTGVEEENDSLIRQETADEEMMCR